MPIHPRPAPSPVALLACWLLAACGGGAAEPDDRSDDARVGDAGVGDGGGAVADAGPGAIDAGADAMAEPGYQPQPAVSIPPAPPPEDLAGYPVDDQGRPILGVSGSLHLVERAPDALTALSECTAMIVRCVDPAVEGRTLDACVISPPRCATATPWQEAACCADACIDDYEQRRVAGTAPLTAFRQAFYGRPSCAPGVEARLGGGQ